MIGRRKMYLLLCLGWVLTCVVSKSGAQIPGMRKYTQQDGFSATNGYEFEQDERGFLWIGTDNGGISFDGKKFRGIMEKESFPDAEILAIRPLTYDRVLMVPITNNVCYLEKGKLITEKEDVRLRDARSPNHNVTRLDAITGAFWLSDGSRLTTLYRFKGKDIQRYVIGNAGFIIQSVIGDCFIGSMFDSARKATYACMYDLATGAYQYCYNEAGQRLPPTEGFLNVSADTNYLVSYHYLRKEAHIYQYKAGDSILKLVKTISVVSHGRIPPLLTLDRNRNLWGKTLGMEGMWYYGSALENTVRPDTLHIQESEMVNSIFIDRNSNLWMSSQNNALYFISKKHFRNALLTNRFPNKKKVPKSISGDGKGRLLISYTNSDELISMNNTQYKTVPLNDFFQEGARNIIPIEKNRFLVFNGMAAIYDMDANSVNYIKATRFACKDICPYKENDLLIAESSSIVHIGAYQSSKPVVTPFFNGRSTAVAAMPNGHVLIGTPTGLYLKQTLQAKPLKISNALLGESNITDIQSLPGENALIGTNANGLFLYRSDKSVQPVKVEKLKHVRSIYKQNDSAYWISTNKGVYSLLFNYNWSVKSIRNYTFYDGLPSNNATSVYVCRDTAYVATSEGIRILPLKDSTLLQMAPPDIYLNTVQTDKTTVWYPDSLLTLASNQNNLLISLSAISYESLGNVQYYYRLYPLQTQWIATMDPDVRFAKLPYGNYTFEAYALNAKGVRSLKTITLDIHIQPAFWQTLYFRIAALLLMSILFYMLLRWSLLRKEKKRYTKVQEKKRLAELELEAIKAQINPHFIYNCLNSIQYLNYKKEHIQAQQYLDLFARLIRMTMHYSQETFIPVKEEADYLSLYLQLEKLRFKDNMNYTIYVEDGVNTKAFLPAMLVQPYVENALKHGIAGREKGEIVIRFWEEANKLHIMVQDNGPGFTELKRPRALGLRLAGTRAASYNELFNLNINIHCYNRQDKDPNVTGATVHIETIYLSNFVYNKSKVNSERAI